LTDSAGKNTKVVWSDPPGGGLSNQGGRSILEGSLQEQVITRMKTLNLTMIIDCYFKSTFISIIFETQYDISFFLLPKNSKFFKSIHELSIFRNGTLQTTIQDTTMDIGLCFLYIIDLYFYKLHRYSSINIFKTLVHITIIIFFRCYFE
jgi:hypothetical protein